MFPVLEIDQILKEYGEVKVEALTVKRGRSFLLRIRVLGRTSKTSNGN